MADAITVEKVHVTRTPGLCGGKACIAGTRIRVQDIYVWHERQGQSPDEIVSQFKQLTLADVYAALAYFWDHRDEILQQMADETALYEKMKQQNPSLLAEKLRAMNRGTDGDAVSLR